MHPVIGAVRGSSPRSQETNRDRGTGTRNPGTRPGTEKLFGAKDKTKADLDNERDGKDTGIERTRRLFYVTCSRTKKSLALIAYSSRPDKIRDYVIREGWFEDEEVQLAT